MSYAVVCTGLLVIAWLFRVILNQHIVPKLLYQPPSPLPNQLDVLKVEPAGRHKESKKAILFFHGNASLASYMQREAEILAQTFQCAVYVLEYAGYGNYEQFNFAENTQDFLVKQATKIAKQHQELIIIGQSLGSHFAARVAQHLQATGKIRNVVLISPFFNFCRLVQDVVGVPAWLARILLTPENHFDTAKALRNLPLHIIHGDSDRLIPVSHAKALHQDFPGSRLTIVPDQDHNGFDFQAIAGFIQGA